MGAMNRPIRSHVTRLTLLDLQKILDNRFPGYKMIITRSNSLHWVVQIDYSNGTLSASSILSMEHAIKDILARRG